MKKGTFSLLIVTGLLFISVACKKKGCMDPAANNYSSEAKKDDGSCTYDDPTVTNTIVEGNITSNTTWSASKIYELKGKVVVKSGYTLTIEAGTIIKAQEGSDVNASALIIERGAKISANGTSLKPIIFTSVLDNITIGQLSGTNLTEGDAGKWGGLIVLGNAPVSTADGNSVGQIEGIPATESYGSYGGSNPADNSGTLNYISIRHSGTVIGSGNEINGLTLGGVGYGTTVSNIEVLSNLDDGIEIFGGTVNVSNVLISFIQDDAIDVDQNWAGTLDNFYVINNTGTGSDEGMEIDGPEGTLTDGYFTIKNGTCIIYGGGEARADFKSKAQGTVENVTFGKARISASFNDADCTDKLDAFTNLVSDKLKFVNAKFTEISVETSSTLCTVPSNYNTVAGTFMSSNSAATGADKSVFNSWSWTSIKGKL
ncbi:MAG: hypothetical protein HYU67_10745 [Flavobacteriia bacterium]|nr:hypothetical protein [Flavobacteriia bacterium]